MKFPMEFPVSMDEEPEPPEEHWLIRLIKRLLDWLFGMRSE